MDARGQTIWPGIVGLPALAVTVGLLASPWPLLAVVPGVGAVGFAVLVRRPDWGILMVVAMIPFGAYRKLGGDLNLPWVIAGVVAVGVLLRMGVLHRLPSRPAVPAWPAFLAYFCIVVFSYLFSPFPDEALHHLVLQGAAYVFILLVITCLGPDEFRGSLPSVLVWSVSLGSVLGIAGYLGFNAFSEEHTGHITRAVGGAIDPNNMAVMTVFVLPFIVHRMLFAARLRHRVLMLGLLGLNVVAILLTMSRSGFLILVLALVSLAVHHRARFSPRRLAGMAGAVLVALGLGVMAAPPELFQRQASLLEWQDASLSRRTSYLGVAADAFLERPLIGSGLGVFRDIYAQTEVARTYSRHPARWERRAHNTYLEVLVGCGVLGLAAWLWVLGWSLTLFRASERRLAAAGDAAGADALAAWRIALALLLVFLLTFSELFHKFMLLGLAAAQVAPHWRAQTEGKDA